MSLQDEEGPLDEEVVNELVAATPESWKAASLEIRGSPLTLGSYECRISNPEGLNDRVEATEELKKAILELARLFERHGHHWSAARYEVRQRPDKTWDYQVDFEYATPPVH